MQKHHDLLLVTRKLFRAAHNQRGRKKILLLQGVRMHPVGSGISGWKSVTARFAGLEQRHRHIGHAVLIPGGQQPVPMDHGFLGKGILQVHLNSVAGGKGQSRLVIGTGKAEHGRGAAIDLNRPRYDSEFERWRRGTNSTPR